MTTVTNATLAMSRPSTMSALTSSRGWAARSSINDHMTASADAVVSPTPHRSMRGGKVTKETLAVISIGNRKPERYDSNHASTVNPTRGVASSMTDEVRTHPATLRRKHPSHTRIIEASTSAAGHSAPPCTTAKNTVKGTADITAMMRY